MRQRLTAVRGQTFDVAIIGGGAIGLAAARDAARRGLSVALFEANDYCWGTTARSTRLIHGGLRYLEMLDFELVREDLRERELLLRNAGHLVRPLPFLTPLYRRGPLYAAYLRTGLTLYDALSFDKSLPNHRFLSRAEALRAEPGLNPDGLEGAAVYYDAQAALVERLGLEHGLDAHAHGAYLFNHTRVVELRRRGATVVGVTVEDRLTGETADISARVTLNATGPWADGVTALARPARRLLRRTKGVHLVSPKVADHAIVLFAPDGRLYFVVPWLDFSYVGTTDTDWDGDLESVAADADDVEYLRAGVSRAFPTADWSRVFYTTAGVRALVRVEGVRESAVSRKHVIWDHARREGIDGLLSILGGKLTAQRSIAEEAIDRICVKLDRPRRADTANAPLPGAPTDRGWLATATDQLRRDRGLTEAQATNLVTTYGRRVDALVALADQRPDDRLMDPLSTHGPELRAQVALAVEAEGARMLADVMRRRTTIGWRADQGMAALESVAELMALRLGWSPSEVNRQIAIYRREAALGVAWQSPLEPAELQLTAD